MKHQHPYQPHEQTNSQLRAELAASEDRLVRTTADLEDQRERCRRELDEQKKYSGIELMRDLLPVLDNLERSILAGRHSGDFDALMEAAELVRKQFYEALSKHGLRKVADFSTPFDPTQHHAVGEKQCDTQPDGSVTDVVEQGYRMHDRLMRPSKVIVARDHS